MTDPDPAEQARAQGSTEQADARSGTRSRIVTVAATLLKEQGPVAVTTRAVADGAGVQAPTIYRHFGDKDGLLEAVAEHVMEGYVAAKAARERAATEAGNDPVEDLRASWDAQIDFGLTNPAVFRLLSDPARAQGSPAARAGQAVLEGRVHRVALAGRLRVGERRAVDLVQAAGVGAIQLLLSRPPQDRDRALSTALLDAVLARVLADPPPPTDDRVTAAAVAFRALVPRLDVLSEGERSLLAEWLDRVVATDR